MYKKICLFLIVLLVSFSILFYSVVNSLRHNVLNFDTRLDSELEEILPQQWGFYSKNPRTTDLVYFKVDGNDLLYPNARLGNLWGINRKARAQGTEAGGIFEKLSSKNKIKKTDVFYSDLKEEIKNEPYIQIKNDDTFQSLKGKYIFFTGEYTPYAWAKNTNDRYIVKKYAKVDIQ
ncbi:SdpA family antimicrobial peptide system protein [Mammaliicoccus sciuri]|uniref:SdpA family antimicrobial peptide system protein n=1 Tax=Mammaliicoccus sciuri TaxID=1296 RepID=UPI0034DD1B2F